LAISLIAIISLDGSGIILLDFETRASRGFVDGVRKEL
jgi:hypothetical protein